jgi:signal transduction histidine kinase
MADQVPQSGPNTHRVDADAILEVIGRRQVDVILGQDGLSYVRAKDLHDLDQRQQQALLHGQQRLRLALESVRMIAFEWDIQRNEVQRVASSDPTLGPTDNASPSSIEAVCEVVLPEDRALFMAHVQAALVHPDGRYESEFRIVRAGGQIAWLYECGTVERDADGRPAFLIGLSQDVTERKRNDELLRQAKAEAERANQAKSRFLATASHDLRQPLAALNLYASMLKTTRAVPGQKLVTNIQVCIDRLNELLNDLLDLSKFEAGVIVPHVQDFSVTELFDSLAPVHAPDAALKGLCLRWMPSPCVVCTDLVLLRRALGNLIANAVRYTERGGVLIACRRRQGKTWIEVWDTGIGIPAGRTGEIFEEFKQLGGGACNKGSGLGLAIVARTAALLGLSINVRSRVGRGSVFAIELPLAVALVDASVPAGAA